MAVDSNVFLEPCPVCGEPADMITTAAGSYYARCNNERCSFDRFARASLTRQDAAKQWNDICRRHIESRTEEIKPCSFCGESAVLLRPKKDNLLWNWLRRPPREGCLVMCGNPLCSSKLHSFAVDSADAILEWNAMCDAAIKPMLCPHCGAEPYLAGAGGDGNNYFYICSNYKCGFAKHCVPSPDRDTAAKEWNKMISECGHLYGPPNGVSKIKCLVENTPVVHEEFVDFLGGEQE